MRWKNGNLTIFSALTLMLAASFLLTLLEAAHVAELKKVTEMDANVRIESLFAGYQKETWDVWNLLVLDGACSSEKIDMPGLEAEVLKHTADYGSRPNLIDFCMTDCETESYTLLTDRKGKIYEALVVSYMKENLPYEVIRQIYSEYQALQTISGDPKDALGKALEAMDAAESDGESSGAGSGESSGAGSGESSGAGSGESSGTGSGESDGTGSGESSGAGTSFGGESGTGQTGEDGSADGEHGPSSQEVAAAKKKLKGNPLKEAQKLMTKSMLSLVVEDTSALSERSIRLSETVSHRKLETGMNPEKADGDWYDKILFEQYLTSRFGCYTAPVKEHALFYEKEYLLFGMSDDLTNLELAASAIMDLREAANFLYLMSDEEKKSEALAVATVLTSIFGIPEAAEVLQYGLLAAWAYVESILDVRALLDGDAVPMLKSYETWTSDLYWLAGSLGTFSKAKSSPTGVRYERYLELMLLLPSDKNLAYRAMDLQEKMIRGMEGCENFQMDHMIVSMQACCSYRYKPIFLSVSAIVPKKVKYLYQSQTVKYSYWKAGV